VIVKSLLGEDDQEALRKLRDQWINESIERAFEDPSWARICCDPKLNPCPTAEDLLPREKSELN